MIYIALIYSLGLQIVSGISNKLCLEFDTDDKCVQCVDNSQNKNDTCQCNFGFVTSDLINYCQQCLTDCETCDISQLNKCLTCGDQKITFRQLNPQTKQCDCISGYSNVPYQFACIKDNIDIHHLKYIALNSDFQNQQFIFCESSLDVNSLLDKIYLSTNGQNIYFNESTIEKHKINSQFLVSFIINQARSYLYFDNSFSEDNVRAEKRNFLDSKYNLTIDSSQYNDDLIVGIDIQNIELNDHFNVLLTCGKRGFLNEEESNIVINHIMRLFYICKTPCQQCSIDQNKIICERCKYGFKLIENQCIYDTDQQIKIKEIQKLKDSIKCGQGYFDDQKQCKPCIENCYQCENNNSCQQCNEGFQEDNDDKCIKCESQEQCSLNQDCKTKNCKLCDQNNQCIQCKQGYYLNDLSCIRMIDQNNLICSKSKNCYLCNNLISKLDHMNLQCQCNQGFYFDSLSQNCEQCSDNCKNCEYRKSKCINCLPQGYLEDEQCKTCSIPFCLKCKSKDQCNECEITHYLNILKQCIKCDIENCKRCKSENECLIAEDKYYIEQGQVKSCEIDKCNKCIKETNKIKCQQCESGFYLDEICKPCYEGCSQCYLNEKNEQHCQRCSQSYYLDKENMNCHRCISNCNKCTNQQNCFECTNGLQLFVDQCICKRKDQYLSENGQCVNCQEGCKVCESKDECTKCVSSYYLELNNCIKCPEGCLECDNIGCTECQDGLYLNKNKCGCIEGCKKCPRAFDQCDVIKEGYLKIDNQIKKCDDQCVTCQDTIDKCTKCDEQSTLIENKCIKCQINNCIKCGIDLCSICEDGYYSDNKQCLQCQSTLNDCQLCKYQNENQLICTKCENNKIIENGKCIDSFCKQNIDNITGKCEECIDQYYNDNGLCKKCTLNCKKCIKDSCLICDIGLYPNGDSCSKCPIGCLQCSENECSLCASGYYLKEQKCYSCNNCETCRYTNSQILCLSCKDQQEPINGKCSKETNISSVITILIIVIIVFLLYSYKSTIINLIVGRNQISDQNDSEGIEIQNKKQSKPLKPELNLFDDD